jgi:hypothetical protein
MKPLNLRVIALTLSLFGAITFSLCLLWDVAFPSLSMLAIWKVLLPGFQRITWGSYILGMMEIILYAIFTTLIFVPSYNWLTRHMGESQPEEGLHHV